MKQRIQNSGRRRAFKIKYEKIYDFRSSIEFTYFDVNQCVSSVLAGSVFCECKWRAGVPSKV